MRGAKTTDAGAAPKRRTRAEQKAARTSELLAAAWSVFGEKGYDATTIDEVAERAGYSRMPIYTLFGDKQNLFFELWRNAVAALTDQLIGSLKPNVPLRRNLRTLAEILANSPTPPRGQSSPEALFFVVQTIALSRPDVFEKLEQLSRQVVEDLATAVRTSTLERGDVLRSDAEIIAGHLVAHINGRRKFRSARVCRPRLSP